MAASSCYHTACVSVRAASGLPPYCRQVFLQFVYELSSGKRVSSKCPPADTSSGPSTVLACWKDIAVCVPTTNPFVSVEVWHAHSSHDLFLGCANIALAKDSSTPEMGPVWVGVNAARYEGVHTPAMSLEVVVTYIQSSPLYRTKDAPEVPSIADPAFRFRVPYLDINWADVVATNVSEIFFLGTTDRLEELKSTVLYGNTCAMLDVAIDKDHEKAFQMCQYSAQYLQSCIDFLTQRQALYTNSRDELVTRQEELRRRRRAKKQHVAALRQQSADCDVLLAAYDAVSKTLPPLEPTPPTPLPPTPISPTPTSPTPSFPMDTAPPAPAADESSPLKATAMLTTYEERMEKQRLAKAATRTERIEAEKRRLIETMTAQARQREWREALLARDEALVHARACQLQHWFRHLTDRRKAARAQAEFCAACRIQAVARRYLAVAVAVRLRMKRAEERATAEVAAVQRQQALHTLEIRRGEAEAKALEPVLVLWADLRAAFVAARRDGVDIFAFFDPRGAGVVNRAGFRDQLRRLGFDVPRSIVRRLIQQIHMRCGATSEHLIFDEKQFLRAFDLEGISLPPAPRLSLAPVVPVVAAAETPATPTETPAVPSEGDDPSTSIEYMSHVLHELRQRIVDAARARLGLDPSASFATMRSAFAGLFATFDTDASGDLPFASFRSCLATALDVRLDDKVWAVVEGSLDVDGSDSISIAEFVSFAFASAEPEELGVLGYRLRDAILQRVKAARKVAGSLEAAVQTVFHPLYKRPTDAAPVGHFCAVLHKLHLGYQPAQLSRLVTRLDQVCAPSVYLPIDASQDGDHTISLDELLRWLKLRSGPRTEPADAQPRLSVSSLVVKQVRDAIVGLAGTRHGGSVAALFEAVDANLSKQLSAAELHAYLKAHEAAPLPRSAIDAAVLCMDASGNGVVSRDELVAFCCEAVDGEEVGVLAEQCRGLLATMDLPDLTAWFEAMDSMRRGTVRLPEVKKGLRKLGCKLPEHALDAVLQRLDADRSGGISKQELLRWVHPVRDIEVLLALLEGSRRLQEASVDALLATMDADGNGLVGIDELHAGLNLYGLHLQRAEAALLLEEFDIDNDGILNPAELAAILTSHDGYDGEAFDEHDDTGDQDDHGYDEGFEED
ncbi:hypothetical protein ACHHYP_17290 [Achlya hypogyna]|uniref:EF-hand domain-containing protein n=1 Tax=Achlya hypogyna TaxID=1202772 RepID=A0A1V9Y4Q8_ACHHY|nr:hypothetical protein ACHHYP_17290 [Achlya hypogyna]